MIEEIISEAHIPESVSVIRKSFKTVADEFNLTLENCPTHPSFATVEQLRGMKQKGMVFFGCFDDKKLIGFIAVEKAEGGVYYIEKLSVIPEFRHKSHGKELVEHAVEYVRKKGGQKISIGIIDEQTVLKRWYASLGFHEARKKKYDHLPFTVCFMEQACY